MTESDSEQTTLAETVDDPGAYTFKAGERYHKVLDALFSAAKDKDEFQYVMTLLRVSGGLEDAGWDPLDETDALFNDLTRLISAPLNTHTQVRLSLLLYSHVLEVDTLYWTMENMLRIVAGEGHNGYPFDSLRRGKIKASTPSKVKMIIDHASKHGFTELVESIKDYFQDGIRHAFVHSDYTLYQDEFRAKAAELKSKQKVLNLKTGAEVDSMVRTSVLKFPDLSIAINKALAFYQAFKLVRVSHVRSYKEPKSFVTEHLGEVTLIVHPAFGVHGFKGTSGALVAGDSEIASDDPDEDSLGHI